MSSHGSLVRLNFDVTLFAMLWVWVGGVEAVRMKIFNPQQSCYANCPITKVGEPGQGVINMPISRYTP